MTGRYQYRLRCAAEEPLTGRARGSIDIGLPPEHPIFPPLLAESAYKTALIGKCHLMRRAWPGQQETIGQHSQVSSTGVDVNRRCARADQKASGRRPCAKRLKWNGFGSTSGASPATRSAINRPAPGPIPKPWPEKPLAM